MPAIKFGPEVLQSIPQATPSRVPLKRRASAPELAKLDTIYGNTETLYDVGNRVRLELHNRTVTATIVKNFAPFTMAAVMVVRIFEPSMDLEGDFVLKAYVNRCNYELRDGYTTVCWNRRRDMAVEKRRWSKSLVKFFYRVMADIYLYAGEDRGEDRGDGRDEDNSPENASGSTDAETDEDTAMDESWFQAVCLKMYRSELEVYRQARQHGIDGIDVPRLISSVRIPPAYRSKNCLTQSANIKGVPGILLQCLPGFPLQALYTREYPPLPRLHWKHVVDEGVRIIANMAANMSFFNTDCCPRNTVVHWDPIGRAWKCKIIDFGHCVIRQEGMSDWDWRSQQACPLEESSIGMHMQLFLKSDRGFDYVFEMSKYSWDLAEDFLRD